MHKVKTLSFFSSNIYSDLQELEYFFMFFLIFGSLLVVGNIVNCRSKWKETKNRKVLNMIIRPPKKNTRC
jgi:hypothetical protein